VADIGPKERRRGVNGAMADKPKGYEPPLHYRTSAKAAHLSGLELAIPGH